MTNLPADELNTLRTRLSNFGHGNWAGKSTTTLDDQLRIAQSCVDALDQFDKYEAAIERLRGELEAAEQHVKILQAQVAGFAPPVETEVAHSDCTGKHGSQVECDIVRDQRRRIEHLERELALRIALEQAMEESIGVEEGQTFEERAEELGVTEVLYENVRASETRAPLTYSQACNLLAAYAVAVQDRQCCGDELQPALNVALKACTDAMGVQPEKAGAPRE
jgi:hypothetical protein